jgi:hypothetical protein
MGVISVNATNIYDCFQAVKYCISSALFSVLWGLRQVEEMLERGSTTATNTTVAQEVEALRTRNQQLLEAMKEMLLMSPVQLFKEEAYVTICDFLILFCSQLSSSPHLSPLVYQPDRALQHMLNDFIQSYVFIDEEIGAFFAHFFHHHHLTSHRANCRSRRAHQDRGTAQAPQLPRLLLQTDCLQRNAHPGGRRRLQALRQGEHLSLWNKIRQKPTTLSPVLSKHSLWQGDFWTTKSPSTQSPNNSILDNPLKFAMGDLKKFLILPIPPFFFVLDGSSHAQTVLDTCKLVSIVSIFHDLQLYLEIARKKTIFYESLL